MAVINLREAVPVNPSVPTTPYWCYECTRLVHVSSSDDVVCRHCGGAFVHQVEPAQFPWDPPSRIGSPPSCRNAFQPLIVLHSSDGNEDRGYELYYDFGDGLGPRPLPSIMSDLFLGPGSGPMLQRISEIGFNIWARPETIPASKSAVASLPTLEIASGHVESEMRCAVCKDEFTLGSEARELPCKHIYHPNCIHPWLTRHNTCPVCRHELPGDDPFAVPGRHREVALAIWRLPGGGFGVGRFMGGQEAAPPSLPEVRGDWTYTREVPREIRWVRRRRVGGARRFFGNLGSNIVRRVMCCGAPVGRSRSISDSDTGFIRT